MRPAGGNFASPVYTIAGSRGPRKKKKNLLTGTLRRGTVSPMKALNGIKKIGSTKGTTHPTLTTQEALTAGAEWMAARASLAAAESRLEVAELALKPLVTRGWFEMNHGKATPDTSLKVPVAGQGSVLVSFAAAWRGGEGVLPDTLLREKWELKVKGDEIPPEKADQFITELLALAEKHGVTSAVSAKSGKAPIQGFNELRHTALSVEENLNAESNGLGTRTTMKVSS